MTREEQASELRAIMRMARTEGIGDPFYLFQQGEMSKSRFVQILADNIVNDCEITMRAK